MSCFGELFSKVSSLAGIVLFGRLSEPGLFPGIKDKLGSGGPDETRFESPGACEGRSPDFSR